MALKTSDIKRGEIWDFAPDPVRGREQGHKVRPCLVVSCTQFNVSAAGLVIILPLTTRDRGIHSHVQIAPSDGDVRKVSIAMCEQIRSISKDRLVRRRGKIRSPEVLEDVSEWLADLLHIQQPI